MGVGKIDWRRWTNARTKRERRRYYLALIPKIRAVAMRAGYAVAVHGSLTRDLDMMAMPWVEEAVDPAELAKRISEAISPVWRCELPHEGKKPRGRRAFTILLGAHAFLDLSVMDAGGRSRA